MVTGEQCDHAAVLAPSLMFIVYQSCALKLNHQNKFLDIQPNSNYYTKFLVYVLKI